MKKASQLYKIFQPKKIGICITSFFLLNSFSACSKEENNIKIEITNGTGTTWTQISVTAYDSTAVPVFFENDSCKIYMLRGRNNKSISISQKTCESGKTLIGKTDEGSIAAWYEVRYVNSENKIQYAYYKTNYPKEHSFTITADDYGRNFPIQNNPLPTDTLRVLMIGNSFTDDATDYLYDIVLKSGINLNTCCIYKLTQGSTTLKNWEDNYKNDATKSIIRKAGNITMPITNGTIQELLSQDWDVISLQQLSTQSATFSTFSPYLDNLISYIKTDCPNKQVSLCWHMTWSLWSGYAENSPRGEEGWKSIVATAQQMQTMYGIDILIPTGTAIQIARGTELNTVHSLTRDGRHLSYGVAKYIAACSVYQTLIAPIYGISIAGNRSRHTITNAEKEESYYKNDYRNVTDTNAAACQSSAAQAVAHWDKK